MTPKQHSVLLQAMEDFNKGRCTFEELKARTARPVALKAADEPVAIMVDFESEGHDQARFARFAFFLPTQPATSP